MQIDISVDSHAKNLHKIHKTQTREEERKKKKVVSLYIANFDATIIPFHYIYFRFLLQIQARTQFCGESGIPF